MQHGYDGRVKKQKENTQKRYIEKEKERIKVFWSIFHKSVRVRLYNPTEFSFGGRTGKALIFRRLVVLMQSRVHNFQKNAKTII